MFSGTDGTSGTNEIQFRRPPGHPGQGASSDGDFTDLTTDFGVGPLLLQRSAADTDPARLSCSSGAIGTIDESDPLITYVGFTEVPAAVAGAQRVAAQDVPAAVAAAATRIWRRMHGCCRA